MESFDKAVAELAEILPRSETIVLNPGDWSELAYDHTALPAATCEQLELPSGATYADALAAMRARVQCGTDHRQTSRPKVSVGSSDEEEV